jgi:hypothetical protein
VPQGKHTTKAESVSGMGSTRYVFSDLLYTLEARDIITTGFYTVIRCYLIALIIERFSDSGGMPYRILKVFQHFGKTLKLLYSVLMCLKSPYIELVVGNELKVKV